MNGASQPTHCGCSSPNSKYECVTLVHVLPKRSRAKTTSVSLSLSHWYPGSGVVLDCIDS